MLYVKGYAKIFDLEKQQSFIRCNLSTSKKNRKGEYEYMHWRGRIVGQMVDKAQDIRSGDTILLERAIAETYYVKEKGKAFTSIVIFDCMKVQKEKPAHSS